ncbi:hypothetical protein AT727_05805 [Desulfitobacterium hafniense]|uniref:Amine oxidase domain-containing protein n=1 Tax=Desulfitobacterium hafniense TaxID=49338 RepID=A0A0W1JIW6_DESHA|nr:NAD(P)/FAD-dependent oxidoreductase [Desulfitobacterium hafniense]KTE91112.1 hypothetical protein AT727_05805 [Desulfitobacterium hafniense]
MYHETIVVGGGMAGMSCALKLCEAGRDFLLITDVLGGRVCYDKQNDMNFGAVFYMENYHNARKILTEGPRLTTKLGKLMLHTTQTKFFKGNSLTMVLSLPQLLRFQRFMKSFMPLYATYKKDCETMSCEEAFRKTPEISQYYRMPASQLIKDLKIDKICDNFVSKFAYACSGASFHKMNALDFLNISQGVCIPIYGFSFDSKGFMKRLGGKIELDKVVKVVKNDPEDKALYTVETESGKGFTCTNLVLATTAVTTQKLLDIKEIRQPTRLCSYLVNGVLKPKYQTCNDHYFSSAFDIIAIGKRSDGKFNVFSRAEINLGDFFTTYNVVKMVNWPEALFVYGDIILSQNYDKNLYLAGDHNGLGMEPAAISGIYAANRILAKV